MKHILKLVAHSLSARLLGIFLVTAIVYGLAARFAVDLVLDRDYLREAIGSHIALHALYFVNDIGFPPDIDRAAVLARDNSLDIHLTGPGLDWVSDSDFPSEDKLHFMPSEFLDEVDLSGPSWAGSRDILRNLQFTRYDSHSFVRMQHDGYTMTIASPKLSVTPPPNLATPIIILISMFVLAGCYFAVSWLVRPVGWIKEGARRIGRGDLDYRIPMKRSDDLGDLTIDINRMADDVKEMLEAKQQLLLAISHELRSPLTRTRVALEFVDDEQTRRNILDDVEEMERLIDDLLESERLNARHSKLQLADIDMTRLVHELVAQDFHTETGSIEIRTPDAPVRISLDATRVRLLIRNLIDNALCHTPPDRGAVVVEIADAGDAVHVRVVDHGSGMSPEEVGRATEPFYRADPARCRDTGGFGLGLYLCRRIAEAHGGTLEIESEAGRGTRVTLTLPRDTAQRVA